MPWWYVFRQTKANTANISHFRSSGAPRGAELRSLVRPGNEPPLVPPGNIQRCSRVAGRRGRVAAAHWSASDTSGEERLHEEAYAKDEQDPPNAGCEPRPAVVVVAVTRASVIAIRQRPGAECALLDAAHDAAVELAAGPGRDQRDLCCRLRTVDPGIGRSWTYR